MLRRVIKIIRALGIEGGCKFSSLNPSSATMW